MKVLSVIVPVYYNERSISALGDRLKAVSKQLLQQSIEMELIFVDDGSGDNSLDELLKLRKQHDSIRIIKLTRNFGSIHAIKTGLQYVKGDCFTILAADLQDPPEIISQMVAKWQEGSKFVICERTGRDDPFLSRLFAALYYRIVLMVVDKNYPKGGFDLALMDRAMLPYMKESGKNVYTLLYAYWLGFKPDIMHYKREKRLHGKSKWTFTKKLKVFLDVILGFSFAPIRIMSLIGFFVSTISFLYGAFIVINALLGNMVVPGFATITTLITFLLGLIIVMLGVIGEYLWRILDEVQSRPESVIEEIY
jgi:dolichol-phosphate mannosyltransferase